MLIILHTLGIKIQATKSTLKNAESNMQEVDTAPNHKTNNTTD